MGPHSGGSAGDKKEQSSDSWYNTTLCQMRDDLRWCDSINSKGPEKVNLRTQEVHQWLSGAGPQGCFVGGEDVVQSETVVVTA